MSLFNSFFLGGFECSSHRRKDGKRLDVIAATRHDVNAEADYRMLVERGIRGARDGLRWHLIEPAGNGRYDWSSFLPQLRAAKSTGMQVIWDLMHYGWPDSIDIWGGQFIDRFAAFAGAAARLVVEETGDTPWFCPVNEISFFAWAGGDVAYLNPVASGRGDELKRQLIRASIVAIDAIRSVAPSARIMQAEPVINIIPDPEKGRKHRDEAIGHTMSQFQACDGIGGYQWPELGGKPEYLDVIGVNYYWNNQWIHHGRTVDIGDPLYRPFRDILKTTCEHFRRPVLIAETGIENERRPSWLRYVCEEVRAAIEAGLPVEGICLYPIMNHPGWDDDRDCHNGLIESAPGSTLREVYQPLADELARQQALKWPGQPAAEGA